LCDLQFGERQWFWVESIEPEQLLASYYELCMSNKNDHTAQAVNLATGNENTQDINENIRRYQLIHACVSLLKKVVHSLRIEK